MEPDYVTPSQEAMIHEQEIRAARLDKGTPKQQHLENLEQERQAAVNILGLNNSDSSASAGSAVDRSTLAARQDAEEMTIWAKQAAAEAREDAKAKAASWKNTIKSGDTTFERTLNPSSSTSAPSSYSSTFPSSSAATTTAADNTAIHGGEGVLDAARETAHNLWQSVKEASLNVLGGAREHVALSADSIHDVAGSTKSTTAQDAFKQAALDTATYGAAAPVSHPATDSSTTLTSDMAHHDLGSGAKAALDSAQQSAHSVWDTIKNAAASIVGGTHDAPGVIAPPSDTVTPPARSVGITTSSTADPAFTEGTIPVGTLARGAKETAHDTTYDARELAHDAKMKATEFAHDVSSGAQAALNKAEEGAHSAWDSIKSAASSVVGSDDTPALSSSSSSSSSAATVAPINPTSNTSFFDTSVAVPPESGVSATTYTHDVARDAHDTAHDVAVNMRSVLDSAKDKIEHAWESVKEAVVGPSSGTTYPLEVTSSSSADAFVPAAANVLGDLRIQDLRSNDNIPVPAVKSPSMLDAAKDKVEHAWESVKEAVVGPSSHSVPSTSVHTVDVASSSSSDAFVPAAANVLDDLHLHDQVVNDPPHTTTQDKVHDAKLAAKDAAHTVKMSAEDAWHSAKLEAEAVGHDVKFAAREAVQETRQGAHDFNEILKEAGRESMDKVEDAAQSLKEKMTG